MKQLPLASIRIDGGTQSRAALDDDAVTDYAAAIRDGTDFPPVVVFFDGKANWLADGFHRFHAYRQAGAVEIAADVREGTKRDAVLFSVGANVEHGLRRTNADKRSAVMILLDDKEWSKWSDREIAKRAGVTHPFVAGLRPKVVTVTTPDETSKPDKSAAKAAREAQQVENDRQRDAARAALPDGIKRGEQAKARNGSAHAAVAPGLTPEDRVAEIEEANRVLEQEAKALRAENKQFGEMKVQFTQGGFDKVVAGKDEEIRVLKRRVEQESADKVSWMKLAKARGKELKKLGATGDILIDVVTGAVSRG